MCCVRSRSELSSCKSHTIPYRGESGSGILIGIHAVNTIKNNYVSPKYIDVLKEYEHKVNKKENENSLLKQLYDEIIKSGRDRQDKKIKEQIEIEKERISLQYKDSIEKYSIESKEYQENIQKLNTIIEQNKNDLSSIEKELIIKDEFIKHSDIITNLRIEHEINIRVKHKEDDYKKQIDQYK